MNRQTRTTPAFSKLSGQKPDRSDTLRCRVTGDGGLLNKAPASKADNPFATFAEWSNEADEKAYGSL
jgi:hypothetical protein